MINAYTVIEKLCACDADSLVLLDCPFPDNLEVKWRRDQGTTEIVYAGGHQLNDAGQVDEEGESFTDAMFNGLEEYAAAMKDPKKQRNKFFSTCRELIKHDACSAYKARCMPIQGKADGSVTRIRVGRSDKKEFSLQFFGHVRALPDKDGDKAQDAEAAEDEFEDEGYDGGEAATDRTPGTKDGMGGADVSDPASLFLT